MHRTTAFFHDERCLWHGSSGLFSLFLPVGGWVQPPAGAGLADSPESKRRILSLLQVSSLAEHLDFVGAPMVSEADLLRVHPQAYLDRFKAMSDAGGGEIGFIAPFGDGSYEIAKRSAGLALHAVDSVMAGRHRNAYALSRPGERRQRSDARDPRGVAATSSHARTAAVADRRTGGRGRVSGVPTRARTEPAARDARAEIHYNRRGKAGP